MAPPITCRCGECRKCMRRAYMRDYYIKNAERVRETAHASRARRIEAVREYDRMRDKSKPRIVAHEIARRTAFNAIRRGELIRKPCEVCGASKAEAHHDDYSRPLDVRWLCRKHHMELHRKVAA